MENEERCGIDERSIDAAAARALLQEEGRQRLAHFRRLFDELSSELNCGLGARPVFTSDGRVAVTYDLVAFDDRGQVAYAESYRKPSEA